MPDPFLSHALALADWQSFYVLVGSSAGALTGLTFVVITISAERGEDTGSASTRLTGTRVFITPTAVHFGAALWLSALLCIPGQTALTLGVLLAATGVAGLIYCGTLISRMLGFSSGAYKPFRSDWIWNVVLPVLAYLGLAVTGVMLPHEVPAFLYAVSGAVLLLLFIGIHNAWDVVVWMTTERHAHREWQRQQRQREGRD
ncbi:MAG TPA: hypothetical protein VHY36_10945 [Steroidobacteraceae bacterium]|jgi:hypothetical protein|nr:hypothetical protein [Steroidobacteraceae bacterium]